MKCEVCGRVLRSTNYSKRCSAHTHTIIESSPASPTGRTFKTDEDQRTYKRVMMRAYRANNPEVGRLHNRKWANSEKGKAYRKAYLTRPDVKERRRQLAKEYHQRPDVKARNAERQRIYRAQKKGESM